jgi:hypothetical protein
MEFSAPPQFPPHLSLVRLSSVRSYQKTGWSHCVMLMSGRALNAYLDELHTSVSKARGERYSMQLRFLRERCACLACYVMQSKVRSRAFDHLCLLLWLNCHLPCPWCLNASCWVHELTVCMPRGCQYAPGRLLAPSRMVYLAGSPSLRHTGERRVGPHVEPQHTERDGVRCTRREWC